MCSRDAEGERGVRYVKYSNPTPVYVAPQGTANVRYRRQASHFLNSPATRGVNRVRA